MKVVSPDALTDLQRSISEGYGRFFPAGAVCVNVMIGSEPWDLRPLLLLGGTVHLARFSMTLSESVAKSFVSELEGFSVFCNNQQRVVLLPGEGRFMLLRPFVSTTLKDDIENGRIFGAQRRLDLIQLLIRLVGDLARRSVAHGHISPSNIVAEGERRVVLVDPMLGALHQTADSYLAPETLLGRAAEPASDLYGLGRTIKTILGESLSSHQEALVRQLTLSAPRQRPPLEEVAVVFGLKQLGEVEQARDSVPQNMRPHSSTGRVLKSAQSSKQQWPAGEKLPDSREKKRADSQPRLRSSTVTSVAVGVLGVVLVLVLLKGRYPALYFELTSRVPMLAVQHSAQYETEWMSRDRARMAVVGRAGVIRREPAAVNTIVNDLLSGANPEGVNGALMRVALEDSWRSELSPVDNHAALVFSLENIVPEGNAYLPKLAALHPGVLLAILGQTPIKSLPRELSQLPVDLLLRLPAPFGDLFSQVKAMGVSNLGDPTVRGLAAIVTGNVQPVAFESFLGAETNAAQTLAKVSLIAPRLAVDQSAAAELLGMLGDRGGDITILVRWFDLEDVAGWNSVKATDKLALILGNIPQTQLATPLLADLLAFPIDKVRDQAMLKLRDVLGGVDAERLLVTLATPTLGLSREQMIALVSALALSPSARAPFIPAWFNLSPPADAVLLVLLARSNVDANDLFNLEAARYLRRSASWTTSTEMLKLLANHPEPLARVIAYGRLDPSANADRSILLERKLKEKDDSCLRALNGRLESVQQKGGA